MKRRYCPAPHGIRTDAPAQLRHRAHAPPGACARWTLVASLTHRAEGERPDDEPDTYRRSQSGARWWSPWPRSSQAHHACTRRLDCRHKETPDGGRSAIHRAAAAMKADAAAAPVPIITAPAMTPHESRWCQPAWPGSRAARLGQRIVSSTDVAQRGGRSCVERYRARRAKSARNEGVPEFQRDVLFVRGPERVALHGKQFLRATPAGVRGQPHIVARHADSSSAVALPASQSRSRAATGLLGLARRAASHPARLARVDLDLDGLYLRDPHSGGVLATSAARWRRDPHGLRFRAAGAHENTRQGAREGMTSVRLAPFPRFVAPRATMDTQLAERSRGRSAPSTAQRLWGVAVKERSRREAIAGAGEVLAVAARPEVRAAPRREIAARAPRRC